MMPPHYSTFASHIANLSTTFSYQMDQPYMAGHFGAAYPGRVTESIQRALLGSVASLAYHTLGGGGFVEIGCAEGCTSSVLGALAHRFGTTLTCVDPYNGQQEGTDALYARFLEATKPLGSSVVHARVSSLEPLGIQSVVSAKPCLVFVDGLHYEWAAYRDVMTAHEALPSGGVVCVDDTNHLARDAGRAFKQAVDQGLFRLVSLDLGVEQSLYRYKSWHWGVKA